MEITIDNWQRIRSHVEGSRYAVVRLGDHFVIGRYLMARNVARELKRRSVLGDQLREQLLPFGI